MKICFGGDVFLGGDLLDKNAAGAITVPCFNDVDLRVVNLEQAISDSHPSSDKCTLFTGSSATQNLSRMNVDVVNLANNHIHDKGLLGIAETVKHLRSSGIPHFGAGINIDEAATPYWLDNRTALLGYCDYDKSYLMQVAVATTSTPGVNPLRFESIIRDLDKLPLGSRAILYFHWGREHVWLPPRNDIALAKLLLDDGRVALIVGMHSHRSQGYVTHNGKRAYMSVGNFLFPNFFIAPPTQIHYPKEPIEKLYVTRQYHRVHDVTYKKWRWINRISMILIFDTKSGEVGHKFVVQSDDEPTVIELKGISKVIMAFVISALSWVYLLPLWAYSCLERGSTVCGGAAWRIQTYCFQMRQLGVMKFCHLAIAKLTKKCR